MDNQEYDKAVQDFYSNLYKDYFLKNGLTGDGEEDKLAISAIFNQYADFFNQHVSNRLIADIEKKTKNLPITIKLEAYPSMFWLTNEGKIKLDAIAEESLVNAKSYAVKKDGEVYIITESNLKTAFMGLINDLRVLGTKDKREEKHLGEFYEFIKNTIKNDNVVLAKEDAIKKVIAALILSNNGKSEDLIEEKILKALNTIELEIHTEFLN